MAVRLLVVLHVALAATSASAAEANSARDVRLYFVGGPFRGSTNVAIPTGYDGLPSTVRPLLRRNLVTGETSLATSIGYQYGTGTFSDAWAVSYGANSAVPTEPRYGALLPNLSLCLPSACPSPMNLRLRANAVWTGVWNPGARPVRVALSNVLRRTALDGSEYEAVAVNIDVDGSPWLTQHLGYRLGRVAAASATTVPAAEREQYDLVSLPEPIVEGLVTEHIYRPVVANSPWGHFFYAASESERALLDDSEDWMRSGREFKSGGYLPVCRFFYRPPNGGPATHFYTAKADECERFKSMAGFTYEGTPFRASLPRPPTTGQAADDAARCPEKTVPLWRYFNQPSNPAVAPNHRYLLTRSVGGLMGDTVSSGTPWAGEGIALCVPE